MHLFTVEPEAMDLSSPLSLTVPLYLRLPPDPDSAFLIWQVDLREESSNGWTALMWACHLGYDELAIMLVRHGAHVLLEDHFG